jgi:hypothetical protein
MAGKEERQMPVARITGQGLAAIGLSVALLWGCVIGEHVQRSNAFRERDRVLREIYLLRRRPAAAPVSQPSPLLPTRLHLTAG